eukprot:GHUV01053060.1.p2 GENE.GHUV01053060.1~~GHUV01053060.1.p2  ORF type:complete len:111 (-),score=20.45 GHUV01053060.1:705-1037(-)
MWLLPASVHAATVCSRQWQHQCITACPSQGHKAFTSALHTHCSQAYPCCHAVCRKFDNKLQRRRYGEYAEQYTHDGDSCGIHSSGAGFDKMDPQDSWMYPKEWLTVEATA